MSGAPRVVGIVAGGGSLPREISEHVIASGGMVHIVAIDGESDSDLSGLPLTRVGWAQIGGMVRALKNAGCTELVIVGAVRRPDLGAIKPDLGFFLNLPAIVRIVASGGDDSVLTRVVRFFEGKGFKVVAPWAVAPALLIDEGPLGRLQAQAHELADIARGFNAVRALGPYDVGQAVVVSEGRIEAIEGAENTDAMLARVTLQRRQHRALGDARRGVLVKRPKPRQELRIDMPAIGPATIERALEAGLRGIAVLAKGAIAAERALLVRNADEGGLFVQGVADPGGADAAPSISPRGLPFIRLGKKAASARQIADAAKGAGLLADLAPFVASNGTVVARGHVLAIECGEGIAGLIARAGALRQWGKRRWGGRRGVVVVSAKAGGDIGSVITAAAAAHLAGVAVLISDPHSLARPAADADRYGLFLLASAGERS
jgi:UDP-2,3-diacylglucosamine hydrolase